jgi:hypothetical protein
MSRVMNAAAECNLFYTIHVGHFAQAERMRPILGATKQLPDQSDCRERLR